MSKKEILDSAFIQANKVFLAKSKDRPEQRKKMLETTKVEVFSGVIATHFDNIIKKTPSMDTVPPFYRELARTAIDVDSFKKSLGAVHWAKKRIKKLEREYKYLIWNGRVSELDRLKKSFFGRASSVVEQVSKDLESLERMRKELRKIPEIRQMPTFVLAGMPNVGKSSLLAALTGAKPEIQPYPFTTKRLLLGYFEDRVQIIDTPGLLERPLAERNRIELRALHALAYAAQGVLFVYDPTEQSGYSHESQKALFLELEKKFPTLTFVACINKIDEASAEEIDAARKIFGGKLTFEVSSKTKQGLDELKALLRKEARKTESKAGMPESMPASHPSKGDKTNMK